MKSDTWASISLKLLSSPGSPAFPDQSPISICLIDITYKIATWKSSGSSVFMHPLRVFSAMPCYRTLAVIRHFEHSSSIKVACCLLWSLPPDLQHGEVVPWIAFLAFALLFLLPRPSHPPPVPPPPFPPPPWTFSCLVEVQVPSSFCSCCSCTAPCIHWILQASGKRSRLESSSSSHKSSSLLFLPHRFSYSFTSCCLSCWNGCWTFDTLLASPRGFAGSSDVFFSLFSSSGHLCVGFALCSGPLRLRGSYSDGSVSLGLQPHGENPGGLFVRGEREVKISLFGLCWTLTR